VYYPCPLATKATALAGFEEALQGRKVSAYLEGDPEAKAAYMATYLSLLDSNEPSR